VHYQQGRYAVNTGPNGLSGRRNVALADIAGRHALGNRFAQEAKGLLAGGALKKGPGSIFRKVGAGETARLEQQTTVFKV